MWSTRIPEYLAWLLVTAAAVFVVCATHVQYLGDTANSRLATAWALVHEGRWSIDPPNPFEPGTVDKVEIDGRLYSTKPPVLPLLMTGEYWVMHRAFGWDLANREDARRIVRIMTLSLISSGYVAALVFFLLLARWHIQSPRTRLAAVFSLAAGTELLGFAPQIDNHLPAAGALMAALYFALGLCSGRLAPAPHRFALFGLCGGLVFTLDMPVTIFVAFAGLYMVACFPRQTLFWTSLGVAAPLAVHFGVMLAVTGSPLPIQSRPDLYLYEASYWRNPGGLDALNEPKLTYLFHSTFGRFGSFTLFPVLTMSLLGIAAAVRESDACLRRLVWGGAAAFGVLTLYYVLKTNNYGGAAYGFRWHIAAMPVLLLMGAPVWNRMNRCWHWVLWTAAVAVSCYSAWECFMTPWGEHQEWTCRLFGTAY